MTRSTPLIIAHRGATAYAPENSFEAIEKAVTLGLEGVEIDLRRTKDGQLVCFHDESVARLTGKKLKVSSLTAAQIGDMQFHTENPNGGLPLTGRPIFLSELLDLTRHKLMLNIEIKGSNWKADYLDSALLQPLMQRDMMEQVLVSSFYHLPLLRLQKLTSSIKTGFLIHPTQYRIGKPGWSSKWLHLHSIHPPFKLATRDRIEAWRAEGYAIYVWTVNDPAIYLELTRAGVDGIITDVPEELRGNNS